MPFRPKRHPELNRLYAAVGLAVLIWFIVRAYKVLSLQVSAGVDAPSRWALPAVGLANTLAIATLLFIVARSLAKLYFERRKGILGARIRTRLVLALFGVCLAPSLMLFLIGRNFISKNVARWFLPETQQVIRDGARISEAFQAQQAQRLAEGLKRLPPVLFNAVIIGIEIAVMFPDPSSSAPIWLACITNGISVGIGELISCTVLGVLLVKIIESNTALSQIFGAE